MHGTYSGTQVHFHWCCIDDSDLLGHNSVLNLYGLGDARGRDAFVKPMGSNWRSFRGPRSSLNAILVTYWGLQVVLAREIRGLSACCGALRRVGCQL